MKISTLEEWPTLPLYYAYDIECYQTITTVTIKHIYSGHRWIFEISDRHNHGPQLYAFLLLLQSHKAVMVGYNNYKYDYPVLHFIVELFKQYGMVTAALIHPKSKAIITSKDDFAHTVWDNQHVVKQLDLLRVHHFDNKAKRTSLKVLEFNMRSANIGDLPFDPELPVPIHGIPVLIEYNCHDVDETINFFLHSIEMIKFREKLTEKYGKDFMNHNDTKIGKDYFIMELEKHIPGSCYIPGTRKPRQTPRPTGIALNEVIFPYVQFQTPEFNRVLQHLKSTRLFTTLKPPELKDLSATLRGFQFDFGSGGIHGSLTSKVIRSEGDYIVIDTDVASFYPNLAIKNKVYPLHLSEKFCSIYEDLYNQRSSYAKKTAENEMLKLALNGVYGDSNNEYSPFLDPYYTMTITINGQLLLCMLAEQVMFDPGIEMLQINTDGFTVRMHKDSKAYYDTCCKWWQELTGLTLEFAQYDLMVIRDVNSYFCVTDTGKQKRIGAYAFETAAENHATRELGWNKDWGALVVPKAAVHSMITGQRVEDFIYGHIDPYDFMIRAKAPSGSRLVAAYPVYNSPTPSDKPLQKVTRYYIQHSGPALVKIMPPLPSKPGTAERRMGIDVGWSVKICDHVRDWSWDDLNRDYYIEQAKKLLI